MRSSRRRRYRASSAELIVERHGHEGTMTTIGDQRLWAAVAELKIDSSRSAIDSYMHALVNLELAFAYRTVGENIEVKFVRYPGLDGECLPVFSDDFSWQAFRPVLQGYDEVRRLPAVSVYRFVEEMREVSTVLIDPARSDFLRIPRSTILVLAQAQWQPSKDSG
jgi:hypothetical protein